MVFYSQISCKGFGKVLYNSTFKGRENGPVSIKVGSTDFSVYRTWDFNFSKSFKSLRKFNSLLSRKSRNFLAIKESFVKSETMESCSCYAPIKKPLSNLYTVYTLGQLALTIFNIIGWVVGSLGQSSHRPCV